jgi:Fe-S cluster assembly ATP-binding protein
MLSIQNLKAKIDNKEILKGLNLKINAGEVHAIMGPNGSGKSTLSNILSGKKGYEIEGVVDFNNENLLDLGNRGESSQRNIFSIPVSIRNSRSKYQYIFKDVL